MKPANASQATVRDPNPDAGLTNEEIKRGFQIFAYRQCHSAAICNPPKLGALNLGRSDA